MTSHDLPPIPGYPRLQLSLGELLARADEPGARWTDLPARPGLYLVLWPVGAPLAIREEAGAAKPDLERHWQEVNRSARTDILYIGQGNSLRYRLRQLARFGRGHAGNHLGGRNLWWIDGIERAELLAQACPDGCPLRFENTTLERFLADHGRLPLANRRGPVGPERWWPEA